MFAYFQMFIIRTKGTSLQIVVLYNNRADRYAVCGRLVKYRIFFVEVNHFSYIVVLIIQNSRKRNRISFFIGLDFKVFITSAAVVRLPHLLCTVCWSSISNVIAGRAIVRFVSR